ncbi:MAG: GAF and ANTAR domain-containing protein [Chlamydiae bacterium]|nr:GAF and ANTAR domain-containing protein [Chlamydiota bacterium]MBI3266559.1 GAF and ANTAR domain-containing protein [Chlamydiota bacterium]
MRNNGEISSGKARGFSLLYEVSRVIVSDHYLEEILCLIVRLTAEIMNSKICSLMLLDEGTQELVIKATQSLSEAYRSKPPIKVGESVSGLAVLKKQPIAIKDVKKDGRYKYPEIARREDLCSLLSVPMMVKKKVMGVLNCYTTEVHEFSPDEIEILVGVSNQAALAIENTQLLGEKIEAVEELENRKKVERAKGILMKRHPIGEAEAYRRIQKQSMEKRRSLHEIAEAIIVSEEIAGSL